MGTCAILSSVKYPSLNDIWCWIEMLSFLGFGEVDIRQVCAKPCVWSYMD